MAQVLHSLANITTHFCQFEADQVLTHTQLNGLAEYLDDQGRLTRVALVGVGLLGGLRLSPNGETLVLSAGVGVTTDGDLLRVGADVTFDRWKAYDETAPVYAPFYDGTTMRRVIEAVAVGPDDASAASLSQLPAGLELADLVGVLFMESYVKDDDLCSGTDCDNLGRDAVNTAKLLLVDRKTASALERSLPTLDAAAAALPVVTAARPLFARGIDTPADLDAGYRTSGAVIHGQLVPALSQLFTTCRDFLGDLFATDPAPGWVARLTDLQAALRAGGPGVQYCYDILKDLVETYEAFRESLFGDTAVLSPGVAAFPKHLLLGGVGAAPGIPAHRTGWYPSPALGASAHQREHARFLAWKLHTLIHTFQRPASSGTPAVVITPSQFEDRPLEERAIPFYYDVANAQFPVHRAWNHRLSRRGQERYNYSYNAAGYRAQGAAASPLTAQIGAFPFFRVEGHVGGAVAAAMTAIQEQIAASNLPFAVRAVLVGGDRTGVLRPPVRYTDIHRLHDLVRHDAAIKLNEMELFTGNLVGQLRTAVSQGTVADTPVSTGGLSLTAVAAQAHAAVSQRAAPVSARLKQPYSAYRSVSTGWQSDATEAITAGSTLKINLGSVSRTEVATPVDALAAGGHLQWVQWLDEIIGHKDAAEDDRLRFAAFLAEHPSAEHFGGVVRGGTLVLLHDSRGVVLGDMMLPYHWPEPMATAETPTLSLPTIKPREVDPPVRVLPSLDKFVTDRLTVFKTAELAPAWRNDIALQGNYAAALKDSVSVLGQVFTRTAVSPGATTSTGPRAADPFLDLRLRDTETRMELVDTYREQLLSPTLAGADRTAVERQLKQAEDELGATVASTTKYVAQQKLDVATGDGQVAMAAVTSGLAKMSDRGALTKVHRDLTSAAKGTTTEIQQTITHVIGTRFGNK